MGPSLLGTWRTNRNWIGGPFRLPGQGSEVRRRQRPLAGRLGKSEKRQRTLENPRFRLAWRQTARQHVGGGRGIFPAILKTGREDSQADDRDTEHPWSPLDSLGALDWFPASIIAALPALDCPLAQVHGFANSISGAVFPPVRPPLRGQRSKRPRRSIQSPAGHSTRPESLLHYGKVYSRCVAAFLQ